MEKNKGSEKREKIPAGGRGNKFRREEHRKITTIGIRVIQGEK